jgi:large subunit ribosomal protein L21
MNNYAIIRIKGTQYKVADGAEFLVPLLGSDKAEAEVLFVSDGDNKKVGKPTVKGASVTLKVLGEEKAKKVTVQKFKSKSRYRRKIGHRSKFTRLQVTKLTP